MNAKEIKKYIYDNKKVEYVLIESGCHHVRMNDKYITCANVDGDNTHAITVYLEEDLTTIDYTRKLDGYDIISLVQYNLKVSFRDAINWLHDLLNISKSTTSIKKNNNKQDDILSVFTHVKSENMKSDKIIINEIDRIDYIPFVHIDFFREGIIKKTIDKFGLGYSYRRNRTMIPIRMWDSGKLVAYNGRSSIPHCDILGIQKYMLTKGYKKNLNVYGVWENRTEIEKAHRVVVYEAEKSVLKRDSLNDSTGVAIQGHKLSNEQISILLSLNVNEIVIAMDNDVSLFEVMCMCERLYGFRKVSFIHDTNHILKEKDSPADANIEKYDVLFNNRIEYNSKWHRAYIKKDKELSKAR